jgi:hypothetical protein
MWKPSDNVPVALRIATVAWVAWSLVHITIWALSGIIGSDLDRPWWLAFVVPAAMAIGGLWASHVVRNPVTDRSRGTRRG